MSVWDVDVDADADVDLTDVDVGTKRRLPSGETRTEQSVVMLVLFGDEACASHASMHSSKGDNSDWCVDVEFDTFESVVLFV